MDGSKADIEALFFAEETDVEALGITAVEALGYEADSIVRKMTTTLQPSFAGGKNVCPICFKGIEGRRKEECVP